MHNLTCNRCGKKFVTEKRWKRSCESCRKSSCKTCEKEFEQTQLGRPSLYCPVCRKEYNAQQKRDYVRKNKKRYNSRKTAKEKDKKLEELEWLNDARIREGLRPLSKLPDYTYNMNDRDQSNFSPRERNIRRRVNNAERSTNHVPEPYKVCLP